MRNKTIIDFDEPYAPKIECCKDFEKSLFSKTYENACKSINVIIEEQMLKRNGTFYKEKGDSIYNIVPFIGERGSGKTSVLLSLGKYLNDYNGMLINDIPEKFRLSNAKNAMFIDIGVIDAGHLDQNEDLFGVVLARMLGVYNSFFKKDFCDSVRYERQDVYNRFSDIYKNMTELKNMSKKPEFFEGSALKTLTDLNASQNIRDSFEALVDSFTSSISKLRQNDKYNSSEVYIVISIDDLDMNLSGAYRIMEQIQSYMMIPGVIIMLTASMENLTCMCINNYAIFFKEVIHASSRAETGLDRRFLESCEALSHEYLNKFLPTGKIIGLRQQFVEEIYVRVSGMIGKVFSERITECTYTKLLVSMLLKATGLYFFASNDRKCFLEPESIRAKTQLISKISKSIILSENDISGTIDLSDEKQAKKIQKMLDDEYENLQMLLDDFAVRHIGYFSEVHRRRLEHVVRSGLRDIGLSMYTAALNIHAEQNSAVLLPSQYRSEHRNTYYISHVIDIIDSLEMISTEKSYKSFINTVLGIATIKLAVKRNELLYKRMERAIEFEETKFDFIAEIAAVEHQLAANYIGKSVFAWFDNHLIRSVTVNKPALSFVDENLDYVSHMGFTVNVDNSLNAFFGDFSLIDSDRNIDMKRIHVVAVMLMFISSHQYQLVLKEDIGELSLKISFNDRVDFSLSSFFVNICTPNIITDLYNVIIEIMVFYWNNVSDRKDKINLLRKKLNEINRNFQLTNNKPKVHCARLQINDTDSKYYIVELHKETENMCVKRSIIPLTNIGFMYNIAREVRKNVRKESRSMTPWEAVCEYFASIGQQLRSTDEFYINTSKNSDINNLYDIYKNNVPIMENRNEEKIGKTFFYLDDDEQRYFNSIMNAIKWQMGNLIGDFTYEKNFGNNDNGSKPYQFL